MAVSETVKLLEAWKNMLMETTLVLLLYYWVIPWSECLVVHPAMAQIGGLVMLQPEVGGSRENFFFAGVDKVRFRKPVIAGDTLVMRMTLIKLQKRFGIAKMEGKAYVGSDLVCEGEFLMATGSD
ncbi:hypothetical protein V6N12_011410 [Hibiscus sabdariffa]|uniref:Beta-hydroxyacyl-ACP dehydratase n=1 Tax=Hibiscus sabdariffa TaxID=183260 RepID=A0ABR2A295_9ROSI